MKSKILEISVRSETPVRRGDEASVVLRKILMVAIFRSRRGAPADGFRRCQGASGTAFAANKEKVSHLIA
ncbi:MAG: hypothetical protein C4334_06025 [Pyrinomonas sp.]